MCISRIWACLDAARFFLLLYAIHLYLHCTEQHSAQAQNRNACILNHWSRLNFISFAFLLFCVSSLQCLTNLISNKNYLFQYAGSFWIWVFPIFFRNWNSLHIFECHNKIKQKCHTNRREKRSERHELRASALNLQIKSKIRQHSYVVLFT